MKCPLSILALIILDSDGKRIAVKYRSPPPLPLPLESQQTHPQNNSPAVSSERFGDFSAQRRLEQELHKALLRIKGRTEAEAVQCSGVVAVGIGVGDVFIFAAAEEDSANELILMQAVETLRSALSTLTGGQLQRQQLCENIDLVALTLDETVDHGVLLETDPAAVVARVNLQDTPEPARQEMQSLNQAISQAKESLIKSLLSGAS